MVHFADVLGAFNKNRLIIEITFHQYIITLNGLFNFIELYGGWALYFMLGASETSTQQLLSGTACTFSFNGLFMIISSFLSYNCAYWLSTTSNFIMFHAKGAVMYICTCIMIVRDSKELGGPPVLGLATGGVHSFHCACTAYKKYYKK